MIIKLLARDW